MRVVQGFDDAIGPCRVLLRLFGAWPDPDTPQTFFSVCRFLIVTLTMFLFAVVAQTAMLFQVWRNLNSVVEILTIDDIPMVISLTKFISVWYNRKVLRELVISMITDWQTTDSNVDLKTMWDKAKFSRQFSIVCITLAQGVAVSQLIMSVVLSIKNKTYKERSNYILSYFPYDTKVTPNYQITWLGQVFSVIFGALTYCAVDGFFAALVMHLSGQLTILCRGLMKIINDYQGITKDFDKRIADVVNRHNELNRFAQTIEDSFNLMFLIQMIATAVTLCLQGYQLVLIMNHGENGLPILQSIHMLNYTCCFLFSLFVYCFVAEELRSASASVEIEAYNSNWYTLPSRETKLLLFFIHRSRKPLVITAGKFCEFSLELYCSILKSSGGYLSMLLAARERLTTESN